MNWVRRAVVGLLRPAHRRDALDPLGRRRRPAAAVAAGLITVTGWDEPAGKCRASASCAVTDSTSVRNSSVCDRPIFVVSRPADRAPRARIATTSTAAGRRPTTPAIRAHSPVSAGSPLPTLGTNGQKIPRGRLTSAAGSTTRPKNSATTTPIAAATPRVRLLVRTAASRVSRARTTVPALPMIAGDTPRRALAIASRRFGVRRSSSRYREISSSA